MQAKSHPAADPTRERLFEGFAAAVSRRGYAATTIADVVRHARVSKRTFYEHFADKEECFLAAYADATQQILAGIALAVDLDATWEDQVRAATQAYLTGLEARPEMARTFLFEIQAAGPRALKMRRKVHERFVQVIRSFVDEARRRDHSLRPIPPALAAAMVGGLNELVLLHIEAGSTRFTDLTDTAATFAFAVLAAGAGPRR